MITSIAEKKKIPTTYTPVMETLLPCKIPKKEKKNTIETEEP